MAEVGVYVPVAAIFPGVEPKLPAMRSLLQRLSRSDVLLSAARLNSVISGPSGLKHAERQRYGVARFFSPTEIELLNRFCSGRTIDSVTVFFRGQILELMRWAVLFCEDLEGDGETFEDPGVRSWFLQACLIASDLWEKRIYGGSLDIGQGLEVARYRALGPFRKGIEGCLVPEELAQSIGRGSLLFLQYLPRQKPDFPAIFERGTGLSVEDYFTCWAAVLTNYLKPKSETPIFSAETMSSSTARPELLQRFIQLEARPLADLRGLLWPAVDGTAGPAELEPYDYRVLRERPILLADDGRAILVDPVFCFEKCSVGPLFHPLPGISAESLFEAFGKAFEEYACDTLRRTFPNGATVLASPLKCNLTDTDTRGAHYEIDACLNYVTDLVLFEIKAVWGRESDLSPENFDALHSLLRRRFSVSGKSVKGVGQLARAVNALISRQWLGPKGDFADVKTIYPVLIVHDRLSGSPGFGAFIADEFKTALLPQSQTAADRFLAGSLTIVAPVVLTCEDVELLEVSVERSGFRELLKEYCTWSPDRMQPFASFLAMISAEGRVFANRVLASAGMDVLNRAIEQLFSDSRSSGLEAQTTGKLYSSRIETHE